MSKPRFSIGEFVCAVKHESHTLFYIYEYRTGNTHPYNIISVRNLQLHTARARDLRTISNIINIITILLQGDTNFLEAVKRIRLNDTRLHASYPLGWTFNLRD